MLPDLTRMAELRENLAKLTTLSSLSDPKVQKEIESHIKALSSIREAIFKKPEKIKEKPRSRIVTPPSPSISASAVSHKKPSLPTTYSPERYVPYRLLWAKVIIRAAYDYALWKDSKEVRLRNYALDAEKWLFEPSSLELGFESICFKFDFPIEKIRQRARALTKDDVKKLEFRERHGRELTELDVAVLEDDDGEA